MPLSKNIVKWEFKASYLLPILFIFTGFYYLAKQYGFLPEDTKVWPWFLILIGVVWLFKAMDQ